MSIDTNTPGIDPLEQADAKAVYQHAFQGQPLDPDVARRVHERAARITEEVYRTHGLLDEETICALFRDDDEV